MQVQMPVVMGMVFKERVGRGGEAGGGAELADVLDIGRMVEVEEEGQTCRTCMSSGGSALAG